MDVLEAIAEPRRRRLVQALWARPRTVGELHALMPDVSMAAVSQHLARLRHAGVVRADAEGRYRRYSLDRDRLGPLADALETMWATQLGRLAGLAEAEEEGSAPDEQRGETT